MILLTLESPALGGFEVTRLSSEYLQGHSHRAEMRMGGGEITANPSSVSEIKLKTQAVMPNWGNLGSPQDIGSGWTAQVVTAARAPLPPGGTG